MGRYCNLTIEITDPVEVEDIKKAMNGYGAYPDKWELSLNKHQGCCYLSYNDARNLSWHTFGKLWEDEGRRELAEAVWVANGDYCEVSVSITDLEEAPSEYTEFDGEDYEEWKSGSIGLTQNEEVAV